MHGRNGTHLVIGQLDAEDIRQVEKNLVLRIVLGGSRDIGLHAVDLLELACGIMVVSVDIHHHSLFDFKRTLRSTLMANTCVGQLGG